MLICRCEQSISREEREKIALFCNVDVKAVIEEKDKDFSIYEVPLSLRDHRLDEFITKRFGLNAPPLRLDAWDRLMFSLRNPKHEISIAVVGKYAEHKDAYKSIYESLDHAGIHHQCNTRIARIQSSDIEEEGPERLLSGYDGILIPGGFGERGVEGKVQAIRYARERDIPFFGICLGMQCAAIEFGRNVIGLQRAHSTEFDKETPHPVICLLDEQRQVTQLGGTMRLGAQACHLVPGTLAHSAYSADFVSERHRHRYEFNNIYRQQFEAHGMKFSGLSPDGGLVEILELPSHSHFLAVQFHPEFKSKPTQAHPLFAGFVGAAIQRRTGRKQRTSSDGPDASQPTNRTTDGSRPSDALTSQ
jgi:CTP synthase